MDAIKVLKDDHRKVEGLFAQFEGLTERATKGRAKLVAQIIQELELHTRIEETIFYPAFKAAAEDAELVLEAVEEHDVAKYVIKQLQAIDSADERYEARVMVLKELIEHHVKEEEREMFPQARQVLGTQRIRELGAELLAAKERLAAESPQLRITFVRDEQRVQMPENI